MKSKYKYDKGGKPKGKGPRFSRMIGGPVRYKGGWEDKIEDLMKEQMDKLSERYGWAPDYREAELPEGADIENLPSFYDFVSRNRTEQLYGDALPLDEYTTTYNFGPLSLQRWKNAKQSPDGVNYRLPYFASSKYKKVGSSEALGKARAAEGINLGSEQNDISERIPYGNLKYAHQKEKLDNTLLDKARQTPGTLIPPLNTVFAGGASVGGTAIDEALQLALAAKTWSELRKTEKIDSELANAIRDARSQNASDDVIAGLQAQFRDNHDELVKDNRQFMHYGMPSAVLGLIGDPLSEGLVIPTAGIMRNPLQKAYRQEKKDFKKTLKDADERYAADREGFLMKRSERDLNKMLDLYEKEYGVRPVFKNNPITKTPRKNPAEYVIPSDPNRGENRNPIFLKQGGKVKLKKKK